MVTVYPGLPVELQEKIDTILDNHVYDTYVHVMYRLAMIALRYVSH